jgi:hypothetical protein
MISQKRVYFCKNIQYMRIWVILLFIVPASLFGQHIDVFPNLQGNELLDSIRMSYTPESTLGYSKARDTLFRNILAVNNVIECIYTDWTITLDPSKDPTDFAYNLNINTEHIYPQSKGAQFEPMRSNMYNLYSVRENVNTDRGNDPFGEIPDDKTEWWYYKDKKQKEIPSSDIELYSEKGNSLFEPKENRKGDVARSIMYFYTIYQSTCDGIDPNYFTLMSEDLCKWHIADPVDTDEWNRNILISAYQNNKTNPFILDCTIPQRSYCAGNGLFCTPTNSSKGRMAIAPLKIYPSTGSAGTTIHLDSSIPIAKLLVLDSSGKKVDFDYINQDNLILKNTTKGIFFIFSLDQEGRFNGYAKFIMI